MRLCPWDRCRLCPAKYDGDRVLKGNCYNGPDSRCLVGLLDRALGLLPLAIDAVLFKIRGR